jgi:hypothetical protein
MGVCVDDVLASVRGVVDRSPHEALDEAQDFLTRQGYSVTYQTTTTLTVERQVSDHATGQESILKLIVMALPQSGGGVRIKVRGNDREAVRDHQAAWLEWSETLPKRETEQPEAAATTESITREPVGQEAPRPTTAADNDMPQRRYCSNCGHELSPEDQFCPNCGRPVHQTASVPTPEADVPVPPPPPQAGGGAAPPPPQAEGTQRSWPRRHPFLTGCLGLVGLVVGLVVLVFPLVILFPGADPGVGETYTGKNYGVLSSDPDEHAGAKVTICGEVFTAVDTYTDTEVQVTQMYADIDSLEYNTVVRTGLNGMKNIHMDDYVKVSGTVNGAFSGGNAMGGDIEAVDIQADSVEKISGAEARQCDAEA